MDRIKMDKDRVIIIGAGITGTAIARELSKYSNLDIKILDKEWDVSQGTTKANSGIIHAGYDDDPRLYPVRADLCCKGNRLWHDLAEDLEIPVKWIGSMLVALKSEEVDVLEELYERGIKNGVTGLRVLDKDDARKKEPNIPDIEGALYAPTEGVISPYEAAIALAENAKDNGVDICLDEKVTEIEIGKKGFEIITKRNKYIADWVINAAGLYGDKISHLAGVYRSNVGTDLDIHPRKGEYWIFEQELGSPVNSIIFPIPTPTSKGVLI
ncbi:MAG TPA: NAD(P)/FAD-dependent oxidoreductase, partial [Halobacteria archaeon]|nr:NAD(P)/FAD-dependent oxidoreductase [Halobacteria archaeon]